MTKRWGESGNIFFTLFGAVALVGVVGAATSTLMRGPVGTVVSLNQRAKADSQMQIAMKLAMLEAQQRTTPSFPDCDADTLIEPVPPVDPGASDHPTGGGFLPSVGSTQNDPWGIRYGYCSWDHGGVIGSGCATPVGHVAPLNGSPSANGVVIAIISAGPNRVFDTNCSSDPTYITRDPGSDDIITEMTYAEANEASGGLWHIKSGDPNSITTGKALDVQQGAQFSSGNVDFSGSTITGDSQYGAGASLDLSSGGLFMLPDETILPDSECNDPTDAPNSGILRRDTAGGTKEALQMCDAFTDPANPAWVNIGGSGGSVSAAGGEDEIQFNTGGVMDADPNLTWDGTTLDVTGAGAFSTDVTIGDELDVTGATTIDDTLNVTGNVQFGANLDVDGPTDIDDVLNVTGNVDFGANFNADGNSTLGGTLGVTGDASFTAQVLGSAGSAAAPSYAFSGSSSSGIYYSSGGLGFSVGGTNEMTLSSSGLEVSALSVLGNVSADRFISDMSTTSAALPGFETEPGTGLFSPVDNTLSLVAGGMQRITIDGTGDVGIGVSNPDAMLDVGGEIKVGTSAVPCGATLHGAIRYVSGDLLQVCSSTTNSWESIGTSGGGGSGASDYWKRISVADPRLYYTDDFVGVGTNDPQSTFHVNGDFLTTGSYTGSASVPVAGAGTRMFFDPESGAFRAGRVSGSQWDNGSIGEDSIALGYDATADGNGSIAIGRGNTATGMFSLALGSRGLATGAYSSILGLGAPTGTYPITSGASSYGIFMGDQSGIDLQAANTMALLGGKFIIDQTPSANPAVSGTLSLDVEGGLGAMQYCDEDGNYCFTAASVAGGGIGAPGNDREIIYNSGGVLGTNVNFVFTSAGRMGVGTNAPVSDLDVRGTSGISHVNTAGYAVVGAYGVGDGVIASTMSLSDLTTNRSWALSHSQLFPNDLLFTYADGLGGVFPHLFMKNDGRVLFGSTGTVHGGLTVDIDGQVGAAEYCDDFGLNCFTAADVATGDLAYGPDGTIQFASAGQLWGSTNYSWIDATSTLSVTGDAVITGYLDLTGNGAMTMPRGDTAQRPASAVDGMIRYNSQSGKFEGYQAGTWQDILTSAVAGGAAAPNRGIQFNSGNNFSADANFVYSSAGFLGLGTGAPQAELDVAGTGAMLPPRGSTADRPVAPVNGMIRYNSQTGKFEGYQSGAWADILTGNITSTFLALTDTPSSYASEAGKFVRVNAGENALEFTDEIVPSYSGQPAPLAMALDDLSDVNAAAPNGNDIIRYNSVSGEWETVPMSSLVVNAAAPDRGIQFNDGGNFAATSNLVYTSTGYFNIGSGGGLVSMGTPSTYGILSVTGPTGAIAIDSWGSRGPLVDAYSQTTSNGGQFYSAGLAVRYPNALGAENGVFFGDGGISNAALAGVTGYDADASANGVGGLRFRTNPTGGSAPIVRMQIDPQGLISFTSTGALVLNAGDTSQRPGVAVNGMIRYNSQTGKFEGYQSGAWADILTGNISSTFLALTDTPASYAGETGKFVRVNAGENALEFTDEIVPSMSGQPAPSGLRLGWLDDVSAATPNGGDIIRFNSSNNKWESVALSTMSLTAAAPFRGIQFNSGGGFGADANFVYTATGRLGLGTSAPDADFDIATTGSMLMPRGDTAQRPVTAVDGMLRYNSETGKFEGYQAGAWQDIVTGAAGGSASAPDRGVQFNSGGSFAADSSFTYSSTGYLGLGTANPVSELDIAGTGAVALARGDTAQRPGTAVNGMIRYNSQTGKFEGYQSGAWADILTGNVSTTFLSLTDTPASYAGETGKFVRVNAGETGVEFTDEIVAVVSGQPAPNGLRLDGLDDVSATAPNGGDIIRFNSVSNVWESVQLATMSLTAAAPSRGIQFNSGGTFGADVNFVYTATGRLGLGTAVPDADFDIATTGSMLMPRGDTAQRPGTPVNGMIRYNSQTGKFEGYQSGAWADILTGNVSTTFLSLTDTPASYAGQTGKYIRVNSGETALEFTDQVVSSVSGQPAPPSITLDDLGDVAISSPTAGQTLYYSGGQWVNSVPAASSVAASPDRGIQYNSGGDFAASGSFVYTSTGSVGIGTGSPQVMLDVAGEGRFGSTNATCNMTIRGSIRFESTLSRLEMCDGAAWVGIVQNQPSAVLIISPAANNSMNVAYDGVNTPTLGTNYNFVVQNVGNINTSALTTSLTGDTGNFDVITNTCTAAVLTPSASCTVTVRPKASGNNLYRATLSVPHHNAPTAALEGQGSGFGCAPGVQGGGGVYVSCGAYNLVAMPSGCADDISEPTCSGTDTVNRAWGSLNKDRPNVESTTNGPQNTVNLKMWADAEGTGSHPAAEYCRAMVKNGFSDWYVPANDELQLMYNNRVALGGWASNAYQSSTESSASSGWYMDLAGSFNTASKDNTGIRIRCVRRETQALPSPQQDTVADRFYFAPVMTTAGNRVSSSVKAISGITTSVAVTLSNDASGGAAFKINGGAEVTSGNVSPGDTLQLVMTAPGSAGNANTVDVAVGTGAATRWKVAVPNETGTRRVFIRSIGSGNFGGVVTSDNSCQTTANAAGLTGTWKAIISDRTLALDFAANRIDYNWDTVTNMNGEVVANSWDDLWDGTIANPINRDVNNAVMNSTRVYTGSNSSGVPVADSADNDCNSWTDPNRYSRAGNTTTTGWTDTLNVSCYDSGHVYCFENSPSAGDTTPSPFEINPMTYQTAAGNRVNSPIITISGIDTSVAVGVSGASGSPKVKINGGAEVDNGTVNNGDTVQFVMTAPVTNGQRNKMSITVGTYSTAWFVAAADTAATKRIFVTSTTYESNLGGISGADSKCQARATAASLGGTWTALVTDQSNPDNYAINRTSVNWGTLVNMNNQTVATSWNDFWDGSIANGIDRDEFNAVVSTAMTAWTGTASDGTSVINTTNNDALGWTVFNTSDVAYYGAVGSVSGTFLNSGTGNYWSGNRRLYCLETTNYTPGTPAVGSDKQVLFNDGGTMSGDADLTWDKLTNTMTLLGSINFASNSAITLPRGDTSQRPSSAVNGMIRYNSENGKFEGYQAGSWQDIVTGAAGGSVASPSRGIQFNSGGAFAADANFVYTTTGRMGLGTSNPGADFDIATTGSMLMPRGDTSQRPGTPVNGMIRYNSQTGKFEGYQAGAWADILTGNVTTTFLSLTDTPAAYTGEGGKYVRVNSGATGLEFTDELIPSVTGGAAPADTVLTDLGDVTISSPIAGQTLFYSGGEWVNGTASGGGTPATPDRGIQFNSGGAFDASSNMIYTSAGLLTLQASGTTAGVLSMNNSASTQIALLSSYNDGGFFRLYDSAGVARVRMGTDSNASPYRDTWVNQKATNAFLGAALAVRVVNGLGYENGIYMGDSSVGNDGENASTAIVNYDTDAGFYGRGGLRLKTNAGGSLVTQMQIDQNGLISFTSTGAFVVNTGDTSQRPGTPVNGMLRYNSQTGKFEGYQSGAWADILTGNVSSTFLALTDTPASYAGAGGMFVKVNSGATGLEFTNQVVNSISGAPAPTGLMLDNIGDVTITSPTAGQTLFYSGGEWVNGTGGGGTPATPDRGIQFNSGGSFAADAGFVFSSTGDLMVSGVHTGTASVPTTGAGTRMFFDIQNSAFRAGRVAGAQWDNGSQGAYSAAFGQDTTASGSHSFAAGVDNIASGVTSSIFGEHSTASGQGSFSAGIFNQASGFASFAANMNASAVGQGSFAAGGPYSVAGADGSFSWGDKVRVGDGVSPATVGVDSMIFGLGGGSSVVNPQAQIQGNSSLGIFMGDHNGAIMYASRTMGLFGGKMVIDPFTPSTQLVARGVLDLGAANDAIVLPRGDTSQRPGTAVNGMLRYNSQIGKFEGYQSGAWADILTGNITTTFVALTDTPASYAGSAGYFVKVDAGEGGLTFSSSLINNVSGQPAPVGLGLVDLDDVTITAPTAGQTLFYSGGQWINAAGDNGTPAGSNTQIQFNSGGAFGADSDFSWNYTNNTITIGDTSNTVYGNRYLGTNDPNDFTIGTSGAPRFWVGFNGNVGVGQAPTASFEVMTGGATSFKINSGNAASWVYNLDFGAGNDDLILNRGSGTGDLVFSSGYRIGIRTTTPQASLDIASEDAIVIPRGDSSQRPAAPTNGMIRYNSQTSKFEGYQSGAWADILTGNVTTNFLALTDTPSTYSGEGGKYVRVNAGATALEFTDQIIPTVTGGAAPATMVIDDMGDVTISSPAVGQTLFYSGGQWVNGTVSGIPAGANTQIQFNSGGSFGGSGNLTWDGTTFAVTGDITYSGTITDVSDRRLKTDIIQLDERGSMLEKIGMIDTYSFRMKTNPEAGIEFGVMAQDIQKIFPELVRTDKSTPENYLSVNYVGMIAPMIEATKELKAENDVLKAELAAIKADRAQMVTALNDLSRDVKGLKAHTGYGVDKAGFGFWMMIMAAVVIGASTTLLVIGSMRQSRKRG